MDGGDAPTREEMLAQARDEIKMREKAVLERLMREERRCVSTTLRHLLEKFREQPPPLAGLFPAC
jgi:hypothetical protein